MTSLSKNSKQVKTTKNININNKNNNNNNNNKNNNNRGKKKVIAERIIYLLT